MPKSRTLTKLAQKDDRISEYEYDPGNDCGEHWLHLVHPWVDADGCGSIHEYTVRDCLDQFKEIYKPDKNNPGYCGGKKIE